MAVMSVQIENYQVERRSKLHILRILKYQGLTMNEIADKLETMYMGAWKCDPELIQREVEKLRSQDLVMVSGMDVAITFDGLQILHDEDDRIDRTHDNVFSKEATARNAFLANVALSFVKLFVGFLTGSAGLIADGFHTGIDIFASIATWFGVKTSKEAQAGIISGLIIMLIGVSLLVSSVVNGMSGAGTKMEALALGVVILSIIVNLLLTRYKFYVGGRTNSIALVADAFHSKTDIWSSIAVLVGITASWMGFPIIDSGAGVIVALFIIYGGFRVARESGRILSSGEDPELHLFSDYIKRYTESMVGLGMLYALWLLAFLPMKRSQLIEKMKKGFLGRRFSVNVTDGDYEMILEKLSEDGSIKERKDRYHLTDDGRKRISSLLETSVKSAPWFERGVVVERWVNWFTEGL